MEAIITELREKFETVKVKNKVCTTRLPEDYFETADKVLKLSKEFSERKIAAYLSISKSQVHRLKKVATIGGTWRKILQDAKSDFNMAYEITVMPPMFQDHFIKLIKKKAVTSRKQLLVTLRGIRGQYAH